MSQQLEFFSYLDNATLQSFLMELSEIEREEERLREQKQDLLKEFEERLPIRWIRTAMKVLRARKKLAEHAKEPLQLAHQTELETLVEQHLDRLDQEKQQVVPDMVGTQHRSSPAVVAR